MITGKDRAQDDERPFIADDIESGGDRAWRTVGDYHRPILLTFNLQVSQIHVG
jgi:hypothetical protein